MAKLKDLNVGDKFTFEKEPSAVFVVQHKLVSLTGGIGCIHQNPKFGNNQSGVFFPEAEVTKLCNHSCGPGDFRKGGKCDEMGCYQN